MGDKGTSPQTIDRAPQTRGSTIRWARFYDAASWLMSFGRAPAIRRKALALAALEPGQKVLDVGCGTGTLALAAKEEVGPTGEVRGIDASVEMIDVARGKAAGKRADVAFQVALIEELPFSDSEFDVALNTFMLHHLPDDLKRTGLGEIRRVLRPDGRLLVVDFAAGHHSPLEFIASLFGHTHADGSELAGLIEGAGFGEVEVLKSRYKQLAFVRAKAAKGAETPA